MMLHNFNTNTSAILQGITMTSLALRPSGHREYLDREKKSDKQNWNNDFHKQRLT
jgi:hypothetical protein